MTNSTFSPARNTATRAAGTTWDSRAAGTTWDGFGKTPGTTWD
ncbi:hypothetical protein [Sphaerisporangium corydalis]|uniref:Uncharacterized protein n=1 Tax=Sphaerisporangium corydalis TaxID=1441875 RepID=A0ABV9EF12_9ACTN|nr:hypothetical protein [Sphaerisporangium corydalis]